MSEEDYSDCVDKMVFAAFMVVLIIVVLIVSFLVTDYRAAKNKEIAQETAHFNNYRQMLEIATEDCNLRIVELLVGNAINVHDTGDLGVELLQRAKEGRCSEVVQFLAEKAAEGCNLRIVEHVVKKTISIQDAKDLGVMLLQRAAKEGCLEVVKFLAEEKVDINATYDKSKRTALHYAAEQGSLEIVKLLLQKGANPNIKGSYGKKPRDLATAIWWSKREGGKPYGEIIKLLADAENNFQDNQ